MEQDNRSEQEKNGVDIGEAPIESCADEHYEDLHHSEEAHHHSNHHHHHHHHSSHCHSSHSSYSHHKTHHSSHHKKSNKSRSLTGRKKALISYAIIFCLMISLAYIGETFFFDIKWEDKRAYDDMLSNLDTMYDAASSSVVIPTHWENMISEKTKVVKSVQTDGGKDCISFVWASDTHIPDNSTARTDNIGRLMAKMMDNCEIPFAVITGDIGTKASYPTEEELLNTQTKIPVHLAPLWGTERLLVAVGNHDGCYGDETGYYKKQHASEQLWQTYFRGQALDSRRVFSDDGTYFYVDNHTQKTRFIILNSQFGGEYSVDENGWAVNNRFAVSCYGQDQLDWFADVALDMPEGYGAVIASHVPPNVDYTVDRYQLIGIINAYCGKTTYTGAYTAGVDGWTNSAIDVDFSDAKGEIIAMITGHAHQDTIDTTTLACPLITIISAGAQVNAGPIPERVFGTDTETSFDVVTVNRKTRTIYLTRVGQGSDRMINY